jgi:hypothetical protein
VAQNPIRGVSDTVISLYNAIKVRIAVDTPSPALKQMPTSAAFLIAVLLCFLLPGTLVSDPPPSSCLSC